LSPFRPETVAFRAGRLMLEEIVDYWTLYDNSDSVPKVIEQGE
jgi:hypothetical protein